MSRRSPSALPCSLRCGDHLIVALASIFPPAPQPGSHAQHLVCLPVTGCSINPTRSFGPALVATFNGTTGLWEHMWIFWVAPCFGAVLAAFIRGRPIVAMNQRLFANAPGKRYNQRR